MKLNSICLCTQVKFSSVKNNLQTLQYLKKIPFGKIVWYNFVQCYYIFKYLLALMKAIISLCSQFGYCDFLVGVSSDAFEHALVIFLPLFFFFLLNTFHQWFGSLHEVSNIELQIDNFYGCISRCRLTNLSIYVDSILNHAWKHFWIHAEGKYTRLWLYTFNLKLYMH